jgi:outer membrane protein assembly factor BamB
MTRCLDGGTLYEKKRPIKWPIILLFILTALVVSACGTQVENNSWPGMAADGDVVYVAYGAGVLAVDVVEEKQVWSYPPEASSALQFFAKPSVNDGRVVLGDYGASGGFFSPSVIVAIYSLNESDGNLSTNWVQDALARDRIVAAPVQAEGLVYVGTADNLVLALDSDNGELVWQFKAKHSIWSTPTYEDGVLYVGSLDKNIYALDAETGVLLWEQLLAGSVSGAIAVGEELLYVGSFDKQLHALDKDTGEIQWEVPEQGTEDWIWASPVLTDEIVIFSDKKGNVFAVEAATGNSIWDAQILGDVVGSPVVSNGIVFVASAGQLNNGTEDNIRRGALVALDVETGDELWREETSSPIYTTPVFVNESVVVALPSGGADLLIVFNQTDGDEIWRYSPPVAE